MSVPVDQSSVTYSGNGKTSLFPTVFRFSANSQVVVTYTPPPSGGSTPTFTIEGAGIETGGTVSASFAPPELSTIRIDRTLPFTQLVHLAAPYIPETAEGMFDDAAMRDQQLAQRISVLEASGVKGAVVAGDGLSFSGLTLNVGAGAGTTVDTTNLTAKFATTAPTTISAAAAKTSQSGADRVAYFDHVHAVSTAVVEPLTASTNYEGSGAALTRSDHTHAHGNQTAPTLHPIATSAAAGFVSPADKAKIDALAAGGQLIEYGDTTAGTIQTIGAVTNRVYLNIQPAARDTTYRCTVLGIEAGGTGRYSVGFAFSVGTDAAGVATQIGATTTLFQHSGATLAANVVIQLGTYGTGSVAVFAKGVAAKTINWVCSVLRKEVS